MLNKVLLVLAWLLFAVGCFAIAVGAKNGMECLATAATIGILIVAEELMERRP